LVQELVVREEEFGKKLVAVGLVESAAGIASGDLVFVILVESVEFGRSGFGETVRIALNGLVEDDETCFFGGLAGFAEIAPKTGLFDVVASAVEEVSAFLGLDFCFALSGRGGCSEIPRLVVVLSSAISDEGAG